ncbi:MAG: hypothetical protein GXP25_05180 [Planctomycetes bacterium]|nr:hypothetical protein [Planctomycetota bacterium]
MAIEGKIAKIIDEQHVIISVGKSHGVKDGMNFTVFALGDVVADPENGEPLERWELPKGGIVAMHAQEKISICMAEPQKKKERAKVDPSTQTLSADMIYVSKRREQRGEAGPAALNVNKSQIEGMPDIGPISVGDLVRSVEEP